MSARILIVDDQQTFARNLSSHLRSAGFIAHAAPDSDTARGLLDGEHFDAMCLDLNLPDGDGLDLLAEVRGSLPELPVVVMSGEDSKANRRRAATLGAAAFLCKPFSLSEIRARIVALLGQPEARGSMPAARGTARVDGNTAPTVLMYSHDGFGLGHMRRSLNIASRFVREVPGASVLMLVGSPSADLMTMPPGVDFMKLPSIVKVGTNDWRPRRLQVSVDAARELRSRLIMRTAEALRPKLFLADHVPAGVWGELVPTLRMFRHMRNGPRVVLGLRDILDDPETVRAAWRRDGTHDVVSELYDEVFVYGQREIFDAGAHYGLDDLPVHYCGYVCGDDEPRDAARVRDALGVGDRRLVVVTGGGGHDAEPMMQASLDALERIAPHARPRMALITGPLMEPEHRAALARRARGLPVELLDAVSRPLDYFGAADAIVTMAGYNTLLEGLRLGKPLVVVPRAGPSAEQRTRASTFDALGLVTAIDPNALDAGRLAHAITDALDDERPARRFTLDGDGATHAARRIAATIARGTDLPARPAHFALTEAIA